VRAWKNRRKTDDDDDDDLTNRNISVTGAPHEPPTSSRSLVAGKLALQVSPPKPEPATNMGEGFHAILTFVKEHERDAETPENNNRTM
jgi:hypothetical protein